MPKLNSAFRRVLALFVAALFGHAVLPAFSATPSFGFPEYFSRDPANPMRKLAQRAFSKQDGYAEDGAPFETTATEPFGNAGRLVARIKVSDDPKRNPLSLIAVKERVKLSWNPWSFDGSTFTRVMVDGVERNLVTGQLQHTLEVQNIPWEEADLLIAFPGQITTKSAASRNLQVVQVRARTRRACLARCCSCGAGRSWNGMSPRANF